jgi:SAM-dependent methyltransferase
VPFFKLLSLLILAAWACHLQAQDAKPQPSKAGEVITKIASEIQPASTVVLNAWVLEWQKQASKLPTVEPTTVNYNGKEITIDEGLFYTSRYGSPLSYTRALDLAITAGFEPRPGSRVFDFGYGSIGHLRMLALSGLHAVGVDVAPLLKLMYKEAAGPLGGGSVQLFDGRFPKEEDLVQKIGDQFDLVLSKNVLKAGYIHPSREVPDPRMTIDLGVSDDQFLARMFSILKPGGLFVIYNFCPPKAKADQAYVPWAEGESPFSNEQFTRAGFEVVNFDIVDDTEARRLGKSLGWDQDGGMNLDADLFAWYTIVRKPKANDSGAKK